MFTTQIPGTFSLKANDIIEFAPWPDRFIIEKMGFYLPVSEKRGMGFRGRDP